MRRLLLRSFGVFLVAALFPAMVGFSFQESNPVPTRPRSIATLIPVYPPIARYACVQGAVGVLVEVDATGKVTGSEILYGYPLLKRAAERAAREWTFDAAENAVSRRELLRFVFHILPFEVPIKKLKPVWVTRTDVEIRAHPGEPSCDDCSEKRRRQLRRGGCLPQP
jgi:TonB family protein